MSILTQLAYIGAVFGFAKGLAWLICVHVTVLSGAPEYRALLDFLSKNSGHNVITRWTELSNGGTRMARNSMAFVWFRRSPVIVSRGELHDRFSSRGVLTVTSLRRSVLMDFVQAANDASMRGVTVKISSRHHWVAHEVPKRATESVVGAPTGELVADARAFLASEARLKSLGVPFRRGYLLSGPPGTGKTSSAVALASEVGLPLYIVCLGSEVASDDWLIELLSEVEERCVILLDDVDRAKLDDKGVTTAGLLSVLDGPSAGSGKIFVLTANGKLPDVVTRPGRVDREFRFGLLGAQEALQMYVRFHGHTFADVFKQRYCGEHSAAALSCFLASRDAAEAAMHAAEIDVRPPTLEPPKESAEAVPRWWSKCTRRSLMWVKR